MPSKLHRGLCIAALAALLAAWFGVAPLAAAQTRTMVGEITHIDSRHATVVVEVPVGDELFTVAGPLTADTRLRRDGRTVGLRAFRIGERVTVRWHTAASGHVIDALVYPAGA